MRQIGGLATAAVVTALLGLAGCATKGYVRNSVEPVSAKVNQVDQKVDKETQDRTAEGQKTNQRVDENSRDIDATGEIAKTADSQAKAAMAKANQNTRDLGDLRNVVANIDDYNPGDHAVVLFGLNKSTLTPQAKADLDEIASKVGNVKRYFITVEGFTDQTGSSAYNEQLSRERANQVISYLVGTHNIPVYRIHVVGLGEQKLVDNGRTRKAREQSRRAEVTIYTAKPLPEASAGLPSSN
jgi:outer membrane protein OmpA-like peptidoglycan-associated protein